MRVECFVGGHSEFSHERRMLNEILINLESSRGPYEWVVVFAFANWNGVEIDMVAFTSNSIMVVDLKSYSGSLKADENGNWIIDGNKVKGGSKANPFVQVSDNKFRLMDFLKEKKSFGRADLGHISGRVVFNELAQVQASFSSRVRTWFDVCDLSTFNIHLQEQASKLIGISFTECEQLARAMNLETYKNPRSDRTSIPDDAIITNSIVLEQELLDLKNEVVSDVLTGDAQIWVVRGGWRTGKSSLAVELLRSLNDAGVDCSLLSKSRKRRPNELSSYSSDFGWFTAFVYDSTSAIEDGSPDDGKLQNSKIIPIRKASEGIPEVVIIDDAHLVSNDFVQFEDGKRYGTGRVLDDLVTRLNLTTSDTKLVFIGDDFESWGRLSRLFEFFSATHAGHTSKVLSRRLKKVFHDSNRPNFSKALSDLMTAIASSSNELPSFIVGDDLQVQEREQFKSVLKDQVANLEVTTFLVATNEKASSHNQLVRNELFGDNKGVIEFHDLLRIHSDMELLSKPSSDGKVKKVVNYDLNRGGDLLKASTLGKQFRIEQSLSGRDFPVELNILPLGELNDANSNIVLEFLTNPKPELSVDQSLALSVWLKSQQGISSITLASYAYAMTYFRSRNVDLQNVVVDMDLAASAGSPEYLRHLYSAMISATGTVTLLNKAPHKFLSLADLDVGRCEKGAGSDFGSGMQIFDASGEDIFVALLEKAGFEIKARAEHSFLVKYLLTYQSEDFDLNVHYKKGNRVSSIKTSPTMPNHLLKTLDEGFKSSIDFGELPEDVRRLVLEVASSNFISGLSCSSFKVHFSIFNLANSQHDSFEIFYNQLGFATRLNLVKTTSDSHG
jgi:hypothetical protein